MGSNEVVQTSEKGYVLSNEDRDFLKNVVANNRTEHHGRLSYMDVMFELEHHYGNFLPESVLDEVAHLMEVPPAQLHGFVTFYTMLSTEPRGRHVIRVCTSGPCHVSGAPVIMTELKRLLGVDLGETTSDGMFTLEGSSCLGICGVSPAFMIDDDAYGNLAPENLTAILKSKRAEGDR